MRRYIAYLRYVFRHIRCVRRACFEHGLYLQGLVHDLSKFRPSELIPYARHFYHRDGSKRTQDKSGDAAFDFAWLLHQKRNKHHWQWWCLPEDNGGMKVLPMPLGYAQEMVCDWMGAGKAQGFKSPPNDKYLETRRWYHKNKEKMRLHPDTRQFVEKAIDYTDIKSVAVSQSGRGE